MSTDLQPPSLSVMLERSPSLTHSSSTTTETNEEQNNLDSILLTPVDAPTIVEQVQKRKGGLRIGMSKSVGNLKKAKEVKKQRRMSGSSGNQER